MGSWRPLFFLCRIIILVKFLLVVHLINLTLAQPDFFSYDCGSSGNYTINSLYQRNLNTLLSSLSPNADKYGFYSSSVGENSDKAHALVLCRGDINLDVCHSCINDSVTKLPQLCPNAKEARGNYDYCMLRYSNYSIFNGTLTDYLTVYGAIPGNVLSVDRFNEALNNLVNDLRSQAASGGSRRKFAAGNVTGPDFQDIFVLQQCTPDLSDGDCYNCLLGLAGFIPICCNRSRGGIVLKPSCYLKFDTSLFFNVTTASAAPPPSPSASVQGTLPGPPSSQDNKSNKFQTATIVFITVPTAVLLVIISLVYAFFRIRKKEDIENSSQCEDASQSVVDSFRFEFVTIRAATNDFSSANKLGEGGFGIVYKGKLSNGQEIAVKRLAGCSEQGEVEFKNEVVLMVRLEHKNLVRLLGFCLEGKERLLIYEFVPNASLDRFIFDPIKTLLLNWETRYKIILGISRGLLYLHEESQLTIIHRDLKAANVLLDGEMKPKIADFGMARMLVVDKSQHKTKRIAGTFGYMPPEYVKHGQFSGKTDVFSFGVLILEILSGKKNVSSGNAEYAEHLLSYVWKKWKEGKALRLIDRTIKGGSKSDKIRCIHIALLCVQENVAKRPTMASVVLMLSSFSMSLPLPSKPAFLMQNSTVSNQPANFSINEASFTDPYPR